MTSASQSVNPTLSVVVPFFNEEESIEPLFNELASACDALDLPYELIFVDDGSNDRTFSVAEGLAKNHKQLRVIKFRGNYGQTPAMCAGIDHALGEIIVTMDGDLQNDPRDIGNLLAEMRDGYDIVVGWRFNRQDKLISRKIPSVIANWIIGKVTRVPIKDNGCSLKAFRANVIQSVPLYSEMHRFIPAMASVAGTRVAEIKVNHHARQFGESKYGLSRIYRVLIDLLIVKTVSSFSDRPLQWFSLLALPAILVGTAFLFVGLVIPLVQLAPLALPVAGSGLLFMALALFLFFGGVLGELIFKTGDIRPQFFASLTSARYSPLRTSSEGAGSVQDE